MPPPEGPKKGLLAGNGYTGRFWGSTRPISRGMSPEDLGPLFPGRPAKSAKVTAIAGKLDFREVFGPNPTLEGRIWADLGASTRRQGDHLIPGSDRF